MNIKHLLLFILGIIIVACSSSKNSNNKEKTLSNFMVGSWQTTYLNIKMPTVNKTDSTKIIEDLFDSEKAIKAQSTYKKDGTFTAWIKKNNGEKIEETNGIWKTKGDSLYVDYFYLNKQIKAWYLITPKDSLFEGKAIYDWDNDNEFDDTLIIKSKRISLQ